MKVVYCDIVGDLFHAGHVKFLKESKKLGDYLIVGLMSDEAVESYKRKPILTLEERVTEVEACKYVDLVVPDCPCPITQEFMDKYQIDYVVHGDDFTEAQIDKWYLIPKQQNKLRIVPYTKGISTTEILRRVAEYYILESTT